MKKKDIRYGDRLVTSVVGKGNKPRDVRAGKATSIFIWNVIKGLQDEDYLFPSRNGKHLSRWWAQKKVEEVEFEYISSLVETCILFLEYSKWV